MDIRVLLAYLHKQKGDKTQSKRQFVEPQGSLCQGAVLGLLAGVHCSPLPRTSGQTREHPLDVHGIYLGRLRYGCWE